MDQESLDLGGLELSVIVRTLSYMILGHSPPAPTCDGRRAVCYRAILLRSRHVLQIALHHRGVADEDPAGVHAALASV